MSPDPERFRPLIELPIPKSSKELKRCLGMFAYYARWIHNFSGKIKPLTAGKMHFPLQSDAVTAFESLRKELLSACLKRIDENETFTVECNASDFAIATQEHLVKATSAWERVSVDFKRPIVTSPRGNRFLFVVVDEYSRFPFAFAWKDTSASSVVKCLSKLFSLFGFSSYVHSARGLSSVEN